MCIYVGQISCGGVDVCAENNILVCHTQHKFLFRRLIHWRKTFLICLRKKKIISDDSRLFAVDHREKKKKKRNKRDHYKHIHNIRVYRCIWPVLARFFFGSFAHVHFEFTSRISIAYMIFSVFAVKNRARDLVKWIWNRIFQWVTLFFVGNIFTLATNNIVHHQRHIWPHTNSFQCYSI